MGESSVTPEKRLLNLIESGGKGEAASGPAAAAPAAKVDEAAYSSVDLKNETPITEKLRLFFINFKSRLGIKTVTQVARIILIGLTLVTIVNAAYEMKIAGRDPLYGLDVPESKLTHIDVDEPATDLSKIQDQDSRNVFLPFAKREELEAAKPAVTSAGRLVEMTKTMKLTGISYNPEDEKSTYCMIEDLQKNITVFLRVGDQISGMKVSKIMEESVELQYENETIEIR